MDYRILIVEDDSEMLDFLKNKLSQAGYLVSGAPNGVNAIKLVENTRPQLIVLDMNLPDINGTMVAKELKKTYPDVPIIFLTGNTSIQDKLKGFNAGGDDYLTKPFEFDELLARIHARLRQSARKVIEVGDLTLDTQTKVVRRLDKIIPLSPQEFRLLEYLMNHSGQVMSRELILNHVWEYQYDVNSRVVDVYIGYLRRKIDRDFEPKLIRSLRGFGYACG
jgi:DNA-binding response OmpR family regulator